MPTPAIPTPVQRILSEVVQEWPDSTPIQVLFSGLLGAERVLTGLQRRIQGSDTSLLSCALGAAATDQSFRLEIRRGFEEWSWLLDSLAEDKPHRTAAALMLCAEWAHAFEDPEQHVAVRKALAAKHQWGALLDATEARLWENLPNLTGFLQAGPVSALEDNPEAAIVTMLPFGKKSASRPDQRMNAAFDWDGPDESEEDLVDRDALIDQIVARDHWAIITIDRIAGFDRVGSVQTSRKARTFNIYASDTGGQTRVVMPHAKLASLPYPTLTPDAELDGKVDVVSIGRAQYNQLFRQYGDGRDPGSPNEMFAVLCGSHVIGAFAYNAALTTTLCRAQSETRDQIGNACYLVDDLVIEPNSVPRLRRIILLAALSDEVRGALENKYQRSIDSCCTVVDANSKTSSVHAGLFKLLSRREPVGDEVAGHFRYQLNYWQQLGNHSLSQVLQLWTDSQKAR